MGNRVVDVEKVERFGFENFEHFRGERQGVRRMVEERIGDDFDFVEVGALAVAVHANRRGIADEVHVVPARGELHAKLGGDDAGAAVSWVACDPDAHKSGLRFSGTPN